MQVLIYYGCKDVCVEIVLDLVLVVEDDLILRVIVIVICGLDLYLYRGKIFDLYDGDVLGYEFMGVVEEVGSGVIQVRLGDCVVIFFVIVCGECFYCWLVEYVVCEIINLGKGVVLNQKGFLFLVVLFGYSYLYGGVVGGQVEFVCVFKVNVGLLCILEGVVDEQVLFLLDILFIGYQVVLNVGVKLGLIVVIFGVGLVGLMSVVCCWLLGVEIIFMVDYFCYCLDYVCCVYGVIMIDFKEIEDLVDYILIQISGCGVDVCIEVVGFEVEGSVLELVLIVVKLEGSSGVVICQCIVVVCRGGVVSIFGVYVGFIYGFLLGDVFDKGLIFKMGQIYVQGLMLELFDVIMEGKLDFGDIILYWMCLVDVV